MVRIVSVGAPLDSVAPLDVSAIPAAREAYSPASCFGPRPSLMRARESGVILVCQPLSFWYFTIAACVSASHCPVGLPQIVCLNQRLLNFRCTRGIHHALTCNGRVMVSRSVVAGAIAGVVQGAFMAAGGPCPRCTGMVLMSRRVCLFGRRIGGSGQAKGQKQHPDATPHVDLARHGHSVKVTQF